MKQDLNSLFHHSLTGRLCLVWLFMNVVFFHLVLYYPRRQMF